MSDTPSDEQEIEPIAAEPTEANVAGGTPVPRPGEAITEDEEAKALDDLEQRVAVLQPQLLAKGDEPHRLLA